MKPKLAFLFLVACGGAPTPETPKPHEESVAEKRSKDLDTVLKEEPKVPYKLEGTRTMTTARDCGQGPFRVDGAMLGAPFGEKIEVYACTKHDLAGRSRLVLKDASDTSQSFGSSSGGSDRCRASATELAHAGDAGAGSSAVKTSTAAASSNAKTGVTTPAEKLDDKPIPIADTEQCPAGMYEVSIFNE